METRSKVFGGNKSLIKAMGAVICSSNTKKSQIFLHVRHRIVFSEIRIAFLERDYPESISNLRIFHFRYGDKTPKSITGRLFSILWIIIGITICSILTATLSSALTSVTVEKYDVIAGKKVKIP